MCQRPITVISSPCTPDSSHPARIIASQKQSCAPPSRLMWSRLLWTVAPPSPSPQSLSQQPFRVQATSLPPSCSYQPLLLELNGLVGIPKRGVTKTVKRKDLRQRRMEAAESGEEPEDRG